MLKMDLETFSVDQIYEEFSISKKNNFLSKIFVFNTAIDFTQDFRVIMKKEEVTDNLINNHDFRIEGFMIQQHTLF